MSTAIDEQKNEQTDLELTQKCANPILLSHLDSSEASSEIDASLEGINTSYSNEHDYKTAFNEKGVFNSHPTKDRKFQQQVGIVLDLGRQSPLCGRNSLDLNLDSGFLSSSTPVVHCSTTRDNLPPESLAVARFTEDEILCELEKDCQNLERCQETNMTAQGTDLFRTCSENQEFDLSCSEVFVTPQVKSTEFKREKIPEWSIGLNENDETTVDYPKQLLSTVLSPSSVEADSYPSDNSEEKKSFVLEPLSRSTESIPESNDQSEGFDEADYLIDESPLLSVLELKLKFESLHIFSQKFREKKFRERSRFSAQQTEESEVEESCEEESSSIALLSSPYPAFATLRHRHQRTDEEDLSRDLGLNLGSSLRHSVNTSKSDLSLNSTPLVEEVTEIRSARLAHIEDDNNRHYHQSGAYSSTIRVPGAVTMDTVAVNGDVGAHYPHSSYDESPVQSNDVTVPTNLEGANNGANIDESALPHTVHVICMDNGTKVYIVGTAHFSKESNEEVRKIISSVRPSDVVVELCPARKEVLLRSVEEREEIATTALSLQSIQAKIKQHDSTMVGIFYSLMTHLSLKVQKSTGLVPGGEFRAAYEACEALHPVPRVHLGDRNVLVTLKRAWHSLSTWKQMMLIFTLLWSDIDISQEEIEKLKEKDVLEMLLNELRQDFPELCNVIISERDLFLASSIRHVANKCDANSAVVAVVGIGHMKGIVKNWECAQDADIQQLCRIPRKKSRVPWKLLFRLSLLSGAAFFAYRYYSQ